MQNNLYRIFNYVAITGLLALVMCQDVSASEAANTGSLITLKQVDAALDRPMPQIDLPGEVRLSEVVQVIEAEMLRASSLPIQFVSDHLELDLEGIESLEDVTLTGVFFHPQSHTFRQALTLIIRETDPGLTFIPQDGHILITTEACAAETLITRVYDIGSVIDSVIGKQQSNGTTYIPAQFGNVRQQAETPAGRAAFKISDLLMAATGPEAQWMDIDGEGGVIYIAGDRLTVTQTYTIHRKIEQILTDLAKPLSLAPVATAVAKTKTSHVEEKPNYALLAFAVVGWVVAFFLAIVVVSPNQTNRAVRS